MLNLRLSQTHSDSTAQHSNCGGVRTGLVNHLLHIERGLFVCGVRQTMRNYRRFKRYDWLMFCQRVGNIMMKMHRSHFI
jgi:hypothetical protein